MMYNNVDRFDYGNEMNVVLSLLSDKVLLVLRDGVNFMGKEDVYKVPNFPLCLAGLNQVMHCIDYELASRRGKSIKIENGEAVMCERDESVWSNMDWRQKPVVEKLLKGEKEYVERAPDGVIRIDDKKIDEVLEEEVGGDWV